MVKCIFIYMVREDGEKVYANSANVYNLPASGWAKRVRRSPSSAKDGDMRMFYKGSIFRRCGAVPGEMLFYRSYQACTGESWHSGCPDRLRQKHPLCPGQTSGAFLPSSGRRP